MMRYSMMECPVQRLTTPRDILPLALWQEKRSLKADLAELGMEVAY